MTYLIEQDSEGRLWASEMDGDYRTGESSRIHKTAGGRYRLDGSSAYRASPEAAVRAEGLDLYDDDEVA